EDFGIAIDFQPTPKNKNSETFEPVTAHVQPFQFSDWKSFLETLTQKKTSCLLALDHLQDPQNFGALCRTAEGLGWDGVVIPKDRSVTVSPGVYSASVGAVETLPIVQITNLNETLKKLKEAGFWIVGTSLGENTTTVDKLPPIEKVVLVLGTELQGISPLIAKTCDFLVQVPLKGKVQSLNVSATGAILMHALQK
ncbi:MAG: 23S rRNA (guanosine(2251)-2'-O)-methyltransferase RlmB, partial [Deltaproteobacteria bacterium]